MCMPHEDIVTAVKYSFSSDTALTGSADDFLIPHIKQYRTGWISDVHLGTRGMPR